jgi:outer membrane protein OmpA-like peptidoglycan-associated protein
MRGLTSAAWLAATLVAAGLSVSACATEDYVDQHVAAVSQRVDQVNSQVGALSSRVDGVERTANEGLARANAANALAATKADAKFAYADLNQTQSVTFDTNKWELSTEAQTTLTSLAEKLKADNKDVFIEIVGHGDSRGSTMANRELGAKRALNVQRFLAGQGVPLSRMDVVSWGEEKNANPSDRSAATMQSERRVDLVIKG